MVLNSGVTVIRALWVLLKKVAHSVSKALMKQPDSKQFFHSVHQLKIEGFVYLIILRSYNHLVLMVVV